MIRLSILASLALCSFGTACGDDGDGGAAVDCDQSTLTYDNFGEQFMSSNCLECHESSVAGAARKGAPVAVNFDDLTLVENQSGRIKARVGAGSMPPATAESTPSQTERNDLSEWIECGLK